MQCQFAEIIVEIPADKTADELGVPYLYEDYDSIATSSQMYEELELTYLLFRRNELNQRTTTTGQGAWRTTSWLTEPSRRAATLPRPRLPTTIMSAPWASASRTAGA